MKKILFLLSLFFAAHAMAQNPTGSTDINVTRIKGDLNVDSVQRGPLDTLSRAPTGSWGYKNGNFYGKYPSGWGMLGGVTVPGSNTDVIYNNSGALGGASNFMWNSGSNYATIQTPSIGQTTTSNASGLYISNPTAATSGAPFQYSPPVGHGANVWSTSLSSSIPIIFRSQVGVVSASTPLGYYYWTYTNNTTNQNAPLFIGADQTVQMWTNGTLPPAAESYFTIGMANATISNYPNVFIKTYTTQAADIGGSLDLGGLYNSNSYLPFAGIAGRKENGTSGDYSGYFQFMVRRNGIGAVEAGRFNSLGHLLLGHTVDSANARLQVDGTQWLKVDSLTTPATTNLMLLAVDTTTGSKRGIIVKTPIPPGGALSGNAEVVTNGASFGITVGANEIIIDPSSTTATQVLTLPVSPPDGTIVNLHFGGTLTSGTIVTSFSVVPGSGAAIIDNSAPTTAVYGDYFRYHYYTTNLGSPRWYREH